MVKQYNVDFLKAKVANIVASQQTSYVKEMKQVIDLYISRQIENVKEAKNTILNLASKHKQTNIKGLERLAKKKKHCRQQAN